MRLGLIAMSGVRAYNEALMALGLTLPGFVSRSKVIASLPSLSLLTLAGLTPAGIDVAYVEHPGGEGWPGDFDAVAIASFTARIKDAYTLADHYRSQGTRVILGGLHVTACPQEAARHADAIVLGEAEEAWPRLIAELLRGDLAQVYDMRAASFDLACAPMPRFDLLDAARYDRLTVQTQRGCPLSCDFCASSIRIASKFKVKPVEKVIAEIYRIKQIWKDPFIELADDNTFANKAHGKRLARAIAKMQVRWFTETDVGVADDQELLGLLRDAGCAQLLIGLEAPDAKELDGIEHKSNWKARRADRYLEAIHRIQSKGISVNGCFILGLDSQDEGCFERVGEFVRQSGLHEVQLTLQTPFPSTPLYRRLKHEGRLAADDPWERCTLFDLTYTPRLMSAADLERGFHRLIAETYAVDATRRRRAALRAQHQRRR